MSYSTLTTGCDVVSAQTGDSLARPSFLPALGNVEKLDEQQVAHLSSGEIANLGTSELAGIIRAIRGPMLRDEVRHMLELYDRETLERMVFLTRRCCRERLSMTSVVHGGNGRSAAALPICEPSCRTDYANSVV